MGQTLACPTCRVALERLDTANRAHTVSLNNDPPLEQWDDYLCPKCGKAYRVSTTTAEIRET
jgi:uncharacterized protein YbaR (Trm112 family)